MLDRWRISGTCGRRHLSGQVADIRQRVKMEMKTKMKMEDEDEDEDER